MSTVNPSAVPPPVRRDRPEPGDRRGMPDRRRQMWWSILYGSFKPRRRRPARRFGEGFQSLDWHSAHLLAVSIGILLLSAADAFMTVTLMADGANEVNPFMAAFIYKSVTAFAAVKMLLTGTGVILMVVLANYRFMRVVRVAVVMYGLLVGYMVLLGYEMWLLRGLLSPFEF